MQRKYLMIMVSLALVAGLLGVVPAPRALAATSATTYYSQGSLAPNLTSSWNSNRGGGGSTPANFTSGDKFIIQNSHSMVTTSNWTISGSSAEIQIESGGTLTAANAITTQRLTINSGGQLNVK